MARRPITSIIGVQATLTEIGRIRFGERKPENAKRPGRPLTFPRVTSPDRSVIEQVASAYGGKVEQWNRGTDGIEWEVATEGPIAIACPPGLAPVTMAYEQWAKAINTVRCDGETCQYRARGRWTEDACICRERYEAGDEEYAEENRPCKKTTRVSVMVVGVQALGRFRVDTKSHYASQELPATLAFLQESGRAGWMQMRMHKRQTLEAGDDGQDKVVTKKFPVITVDAPFYVDEVMLLERAPNMAGLPAPEAPMLPRGTRPAIGAGHIDPRPPQTADREPPPREVPRVELPALARPEDEAESGEVLPPDGQASLPVDEGRRRGEGDA